MTEVGEDRVPGRGVSRREAIVGAAAAALAVDATSAASAAARTAPRLARAPVRAAPT